MFIEGSDIDTLKEIADKIKLLYGKNAQIEALTLVVKVNGQEVKAFSYENGYTYRID